MKFLKQAEFAKLNGISPQAVSDRIERGTLKTVKRKVDAHLIPVDDNEYEEMQAKYLDSIKG
jgi:hypothetical protein